MSLKLQTTPDKISCVLPTWLPVIVALLLSFLVEHMRREGKKQRNLTLTPRNFIRPCFLIMIRLCFERCYRNPWWESCLLYPNGMYSGKIVFLAALIIGELEMFRNVWRNNEHFRYHSTIKIMLIHTQCISINVSRYVWRFLDHFNIPLPNDQQAHPPKRDVACIHCRGRIVVRRWQD